jgi:hypothetical protein
MLYAAVHNLIHKVLAVSHSDMVTRQLARYRYRGGDQSGHGQIDIHRNAKHSHHILLTCTFCLSAVFTRHWLLMIRPL